MKTLRQTTVALALLTPWLVAVADTPLSADELRQLLPGADVDITYANGNSMRWTNKADGTLEVNQQNSIQGGNSKHHSSFGHGTWKVSDDGQFCAHIEWHQNVTDWCRQIVKSADGTYLLVSQNGAPSWTLKISK